jgi:hypothetical protein
LDELSRQIGRLSVGRTRKPRHFFPHRTENVGAFSSQNRARAASANAREGSCACPRAHSRSKKRAVVRFADDGAVAAFAKASKPVMPIMPISGNTAYLL